MFEQIFWPDLVDRLPYMKVSLVFLLAYASLQGLLPPRNSIATPFSLVVMGVILSAGALASLVWGRLTPAWPASPMANGLKALFIVTYRQARRAIILASGSAVMLIGIALILLPGPASLVIPLGLAILAIEFAWARRWLRLLQEKLKVLQQRVNCSTNLFGLE